MPDTIRQDIVDAIMTQFAAITVANGYATAMGSNISWWRDLENKPIASTELPGASLKDVLDDRNDDISTYGSDGHILTIQVELFCDSIATARLMIADVDKCVFTYGTWGGLAIDSKVIGDEATVEHKEEKYFKVTLSFQVRFLTTQGNPYSQP